MPDPKDIAGDDKGNLPEEVTKVLNEIKEKIDGHNAPKEEPREPVVDYRIQQRESDRKALGFTEEQMAAHERTVSRAQAPILEQTAWSQIDKKSDIETFRKEIQEELKAYPPERRTPDIIEKIYYYRKGLKADSRPKEEPKKNAVVETRVSRGPGYDGATPGVNAGREEAKSEDETLDDREKFVAQKLGVSEKDYAKARNVGRSIRELQVPDARPASSLADIELRRITTRR